MNIDRIRKLNIHDHRAGKVLYWMTSEHRANDNWSLAYAQNLAEESKNGVIVVFAVYDELSNISEIVRSFFVAGLRAVEKNLRVFNIPFVILSGDPIDEIAKFVAREDISAVVTDSFALKSSRRRVSRLANSLNIPVYEVDSRNTIPLWIASQKQEFAAHTFRPKVLKILPEYVEEYPELRVQSNEYLSNYREIDWKKFPSLSLNENHHGMFEPGEKAALRVLNHFFEKKLEYYSSGRNDPTLNVQSNLSPYLHFGHISALRVILNAKEFMETEIPFAVAPNDVSYLLGPTQSGSIGESIKSFCEELIVRRELAANFCYYNDDYDNFKGFPNWAKDTLNEHRNDKREFTYSLKQFVGAETHDELWNACQIEVLKTGKMHGYMRMYWAKKILEWSESPEFAQYVANYINRRFEIDGRDPNGYTGVAWSIGGVHDRPWSERPVFGKIRYMNYNGCARKFDVKGYVEKVGRMRWGEE